jgi:hypothetical protein
VLVLHNLLIAEFKNSEGNGASVGRNGGLVDGDWRDDTEFTNAADFSNISASCIRNSPQIAKDLRDFYKQYFFNEDIAYLGNMKSPISPVKLL